MDTNNPKVLVAGVGGVGGLIAARLVRRYGDKVTLIARGKRAEELKEKGLVTESDLYGCYTVRPSRVIERTDGAEKYDLIIVSVKNAALEGIAEQFKGAVGPDTVIMPVMNGVTAADRIHDIFPEAHTMMSVIYTVSMVTEDGSIRQLGNYTNIYTGPVVDNADERKRLNECIDVLNGAGIKTRSSDDVRAACWSKYILNCAYNGMTAADDVTIGDIKHNEAMVEEYREIMEEAYRVAKALGVMVPDDLVEGNMRKLYNTTDDSTSSLSRDFDRHVSGEYELFSKDVAEMGRSCGVDTPRIDAMHEKMLNRIASWK
ncbi:MAG: 2-dehydropantoate 2-reductase [Lachnospiraceae bacterium]|nr:2-dehydropantoate 2-reductase [Lachnospiraceae bacterium]